MKKFQLRLHLDAEIAKTVVAATAKVKKERGTDAFHYLYTLPGTYGSITLIGVPRTHPAALISGILIDVAPSDVVVATDGFTSPLGSLGVGALLPGIHRALLASLNLSDDDLLPLELNNLVVERTVSEFLFDAGSPSAARGLVLKLVEHCKIVVDLAAPMSDKKWKPKSRKVNVTWSTVSPYVAEIRLPFGTARLSVLVDGRRVPAIPTSLDEETRKAAVDSMRSVVCIEIDADMALVTKGDDPSFRLPLQLDRWYPQAMRTNPYEFLWDAFAWGVWLNLDLAQEESDVDYDAAGFSDEQAEVLEAYFKGDFNKNHPAINGDFERFLAYRKALILGAHVDLLNPWRFFRLNSAKELRKQICFEKKLNPEESQPLAQYTLTAQRAQDSESALKEALNSGTGRGTFL